MIFNRIKKIFKKDLSIHSQKLIELHNLHDFTFWSDEAVQAVVDRIVLERNLHNKNDSWIKNK